MPRGGRSVRPRSRYPFYPHIEVCWPRPGERQFAFVARVHRALREANVMEVECEKFFRDAMAGDDIATAVRVARRYVTVAPSAEMTHPAVVGAVRYTRQ